LEQITYLYCRDTNSCKPTYFERVVIQNDQLERVNNLSIVQGGTYGKQVGHSIEFDDKKKPRARNAFYPDVPKFSLPQTVQTILHLNKKTLSNTCSDW
jgi:hypothetical protein